MPLEQIPEPFDPPNYQVIARIQVQRLDPGDDGKLGPSSVVVYEGQGRGTDPAQAYTLAFKEVSKLAGFTAGLGPIQP